VVVGAVESIDARARRALEAYGADIRIVPRFEPSNGSANRLQLFAELRDATERNFLMLDCDTIVVRDPLPLLKRDVFLAKIAPLPTVTHEVFERLFAHFGLKLPERTYSTGYTGTPTIPYFNAGVFAISADLADRLIPEWRRYNALLAAEPALVAPCEKNLHQAARALSELEQSEGRLGEHLRALVDAIATARERQEKQSQGVRARAEQIRQRTESLTQLLERLAALGAAAGDVNRLVQQVAASAGEAGAPERIDDAAFREIQDRLGRLAEDSGELARAAQADEFGDLGTQAESLRLQLLSARNKFVLLERRRGSAGEP